MFNEKSLVLAFEVDDSQTTLSFRLGTFLLDHHRFTPSSYIRASPQTMSPDPVKVVMHCAEY
jgi:hypothetical protein